MRRVGSEHGLGATPPPGSKEARGLPQGSYPVLEQHHIKNDERERKALILSPKTNSEGHPFGGFFKFRQPCIVLRDPELIKNVIVKDFINFQYNDFQVAIHADPLFGKNPFCLKGEAWKVTRNQLTPGFTTGRIKAIYLHMREVCKELIEYMDQQVRPVILTDPSNPSVIEKRLLWAMSWDVVDKSLGGLQMPKFQELLDTWDYHKVPPTTPPSASHPDVSILLEHDYSDLH
uniref:Cytochrome P450 n=1 Tax=Timema cristinae TaxID=61476 RepID=A0A7R9CZA6_TIMCR|nr:unnamed protein product [Timema cristinae]